MGRDIRFVELEVPGNEDAPRERYVVEGPPRHSVSTNLVQEMRNCISATADGNGPDAFVWDDLIVRVSRRLRLDIFRLRWPDRDPLFNGQVSMAGRCAVRSDVLERLYAEGLVAV